MKNAPELKSKHVIIANVLVLSSLTCSNAQADNKLYLAVGMENNSTIKTIQQFDTQENNNADKKLNYKSATHPQLTIGMAVTDAWDIELQLGKQGGAGQFVDATNDDTVVKLNYNHYLVRAKYHIDVGKSSVFNPYVGLGYGITDGKLSDDEIAFTTKTQSSQLLIGNRFELKNDWFADLAYNYTKVGKTKYKTKLMSYTFNIASHDVSSISFSIGHRF